MQIEIVRFSTDNDSIGEVLCKRAEAVNAVAVIMASHNKVPDPAVALCCTCKVSHIAHRGKVRAFQGCSTGFKAPSENAEGTYSACRLDVYA